MGCLEQARELYHNTKLGDMFKSVTTSGSFIAGPVVNSPYKN